MEGVLESGDELAEEHAAEHLDGEKEGAAGGDPAGVVRSEAAGGEHAVDMGRRRGGGSRAISSRVAALEWNSRL
jgi:hypothetical protein